MIRLLLQARLASFTAVVLLLAWLLAFGQRVGYEQSIKSFFADDDPDMTAYQAAAKVFGDDNFVFVAYDDPALLTPAGMDRVAELAEAVGPAAIPGVLRVESLDAMPLLWTIDDTLLALDKLPAFARNLALNTAKRGMKGLDLKKNSFTVGGAVRSGDEQSRAALRERLIRHPLFEGTVIDRTGQTTAVVVRLKKTGDHDVSRTVAALRERADAFARRHRLGRPAVVGPPVLLADGFTSIEHDGRRLAVVGMLLIGLVTLSATQSLWWAVVPIISGWVVWLAAEEVLAVFHLKLSLSGGPLVAQIIVLTMPAASHLAIHFRDDRRREADPRAAARSTLAPSRRRSSGARSPAPSATGRWSRATSSRSSNSARSSRPARWSSSLLVMAISPVAMLPPFRAGNPRPARLDLEGLGHMNRLTSWVYRHPLPIVAGVFAVVLPLSLGAYRLRYESNYINLFKPDTRVVRDYHTVESRLGGIGLVELVVPVGKALDPAALEKFRAVGVCGRAAQAQGVARPLAGDRARPRRPARGAAGRRLRPDPGGQARPDRRLAAGRAAQGVLERRGRASPDPRPPARAAARPRQGGDLRPRRRRRPRGVRGRVVPDRPLVPDDADDRGGDRDPVDHVLLVGARHPASC